MKKLISKIFEEISSSTIKKILIYTTIITLVFVAISKKTGISTEDMLKNMQNFLNISAKKTGSSFNFILKYFR